LPVRKPEEVRVGLGDDVPAELEDVRGRRVNRSGTTTIAPAAKIDPWFADGDRR
jgi:hypothetical protein